MSNTYTIFEDFELNGFWWQPEEEMKFKGTLIYSHEGITLKIIDEHNPFKGNRIPIILGQTEKGFVTLIDGFVSSANKTLFTSEGSFHISTLKLSFIKMIVGERYNNLEEVKFNFLDVKLTGLELWYLADPFTKDYEKDEFLNIIFDKDTITDFNIRIDSLCACISSNYTIGESGNMFIDKKLHFTPYIRIEPDEPQSLKWFENTVWKLKNLYTLLLKSPVQIESLIANIGDYRSANIYPYRFEGKKDLKINWFEVKPLSLPSLKEKLEKVFNNWFNSQAESTQLLFSHTINSQDKMIVEDIFINYTKALESYHRNCTEQGTFITADRYNSVVGKMIEAVEADIPNDLRSKLQATLKYANEYGFQRRIKELVKGLPEKLIVEINTFKDRKKFADKVREVYFNIRCDIWLKRYLDLRQDKDPAIFVTERHPHRISIGQMSYIIKRISSRAGINKEIHPHQLRHSYATHLLNNGAPIDVIQSLLGHEKSETTRIYAQLSGCLRRDFIESIFKYVVKKATDFSVPFSLLHQIVEEIA